MISSKGFGRGGEGRGGGGEVSREVYCLACYAVLYLRGSAEVAARQLRLITCSTR